MLAKSVHISPDLTNLADMSEEKKTVRILVGDPLELIADGLRARLAEYPQFQVVGFANNGKDVLAFIKSNQVDLILLEVSLPVMDGIDTMRAIKKKHPGIKVIAHSQLTEVEYINSMFIEGALGYLTKDGTKEDLMKAIQTVMKNEQYVCDAAKASMAKGYSFTEKNPDGEYIGLTSREREVIKMIALERTNGEIAAALFISEDTVKTHRKHLMLKLNVRSAAGIVKYAMDRRWV